MSGLHERHARIVVDRLGVHRAHDGDVVGNGSDVRKQFGDLRAALPMTLELEAGSHAVEGLSHELGDALSLGETLRHGLAVHLDQPGFVVEQIELRGRAGLEQVDHPRRPGPARQGLHHPAGIGDNVGGSRPGGATAQQGGECRGADASGGLSEEMAARELLGQGVGGVHVGVTRGSPSHRDSESHWPRRSRQRAPRWRHHRFAANSPVA